MDNVTEIVILAGGGSRRMGQDKASIVWQGRTVLERIVAESLHTGCSVSVIGRTQPVSWSLQSVQFLVDREPGLGPLGGLQTAISNANSDSVLLLACDMPLLTSTSIEWLLQLAADAQAIGDGIAVRNSGQFEPLFSVYTKSCTPLVTKQISSGRRALHRLFEDGNFHIVDAPFGVAQELINFNTPDDWSALFCQPPVA